MGCLLPLSPSSPPPSSLQFPLSSPSSLLLLLSPPFSITMGCCIPSPHFSCIPYYSSYLLPPLSLIHPFSFHHILSSFFTWLSPLPPLASLLSPLSSLLSPSSPSPSPLLFHISFYSWCGNALVRLHKSNSVT